MAVKIVTDSTWDLTPELAAQLDVTVVPLSVLFGEEAYKDGVEITHEAFFDRLVNGPVHPSTSQPSVGDFAAAYKELTDQGHEIVSIHISDKLSGTLNSARAAKLDLPDATIALVDSTTAALALGLVVKAAAEAVQAGKTHAEVVALTEDAAEKTDVYFILDTLTYLQKGGRVGKAQALIGGLLSIKPILTVRDGEVHPYEKVRSRAKGIAKLKEIAAKGAPYAELGVIFEGESDIVTELTEALSGLTDKPVLPGKIGSVIGVHSGPDVVGLALRRP
jgi:DegV family protein with EDD domain